MAAQDPLSQLRDIHLPQEVPAWPPAPGWWILGALLLAVLFVGGRLLGAWLIRRRRESAALAELDASLRRYQERAAADDDEAGLAFLNEVNAILRRVALAHYPRTQVAGLSEGHWLAFLDGCDNTDQFSGGEARALGYAAYRRRFDADARAIHAAARQWIENRYRTEALAGQRRRHAREHAHEGGL